MHALRLTGIAYLLTSIATGVLRISTRDARTYLPCMMLTGIAYLLTSIATGLSISTGDATNYFELIFMHDANRNSLLTHINSSSIEH